MAARAGRTLVAMSGGVDSSVAAGLLRQAGHELVGVFMRNGVQGSSSGRSCCSLSDARDARAVATALDLPFYVVDLARGFDRLVDDFARDYAVGLTPNPCVVCNDRLKFGELLCLADDLGCEEVATGHYARLVAGRLCRGADRHKDQSYLLHGLSAGQLARARFPLGDLCKDEVRRRARRMGLGIAAKPDSTDLCFVPGGDYRTVVRQRLGHLGPRGRMRDGDGTDLGPHAGVGGFTVGQRRGLGVSLGAPRFVDLIDPARGEVRLACGDARSRRSCRVGRARWHDRPADGATVLAQLRQHHRPERARVRHVGPARFELRFERPSAAVTPGQYAVLYRGQRVLGGGRIEAEPALPGADEA